MKEFDSSCVKYMFIRDIVKPDRVVTIAYYLKEIAIKDDTTTMCVTISLNKTVEPEEYAVDFRLRQFLGPVLFRDLQKKMRKYYGSDPHFKKRAKQVAIGKFKMGHFFTVKLKRGEDLTSKVWEALKEDRVRSLRGFVPAPTGRCFGSGGWRPEEFWEVLGRVLNQ